MRAARNILLLGLLIPSIAAATSYHVRPDVGSDSNNGQSSSAALKTITRANAVMQPGDVCYLWPGTHSGIPGPSAAATGGKRFTFIGAGANGTNPIADTLARAQVVVPGGSITKPYVTLKGVTVSSTLTLTESADRDSILSITCAGSWSNQGGDYNVYANSKYKGPYWNLNKSVLGASDGVQVYNCDFPYLGQGETGVHDHVKLSWDADSTVEMFNRYLITVESGLDGSLGAEWHFGDRNRLSRGNETRIQLNRDCYAIWRWRSNSGWADDRGCYNNRFAGDKIIVTGSGGSFLPSSSANCGTGSYKAQCVGSWGNTLDSCFINASATSTACEMYFQGGMYGWRIANTVIAMNGAAIHAFDIHEGNVVQNCTLSGVGTVKWTSEYSRPAWEPGAMTFRNNIVTSWSGSTITFASLLSVAGAFVADYNLYWQGSGGSIPRLLGSDPGGRYGDPLFMTSTKGTAFDPHLRAGSPAFNLGGVDAGAYGSGPAPPAEDVIEPGKVNDMRTSSS